MTNKSKHKLTPYPLAIGQIVELKSLANQKYREVRINHCHIDGRFFGTLCQGGDYACGEFEIKQDDVLATTGQHHNVDYLECESRTRNHHERLALAKAREES